MSIHELSENAKIYIAALAMIAAIGAFVAIWAPLKQEQQTFISYDQVVDVFQHSANILEPKNSSFPDPYFTFATNQINPSSQLQPNQVVCTYCMFISMQFIMEGLVDQEKDQLNNYLGNSFLFNDDIGRKFTQNSKTSSRLYLFLRNYFYSLNLIVKIHNSIWQPQITLKNKKQLFNNSLVHIGNVYYRQEFNDVDYGNIINLIQESVGEDVPKFKDNQFFPPTFNSIENGIVLTTGISYKPIFKYNFDRRRTEIGSFQITPTKKVDVTYLKSGQNNTYAENGFFQVVGLNDISLKQNLYILLPKQGVSQQDIKNQLNFFSLQALLKDMQRNNKIDLTLPKFQVEQFIEIKKIYTNSENNLQEIDLYEQIFEQASYDGFFADKERNEKIVGIFTKARIEVVEDYEEGKELFLPFHPIEMNVNRPFYFFLASQDIIDLPILFGYISDPSIQ